MRAGMSEADARRAAHIELGGVEQTKESVRAKLSFAPIDHTLADLKYALRTMRRQKAFTLVTVLTVALGIGVNTGVFTVLNGVLFRDLPAPDPAQREEAAHAAYLRAWITRFLDRPAAPAGEPWSPPAMPPGSPIGSD